MSTKEDYINLCIFCVHVKFAECINCVEEPSGSSMLSAHWTMPLSKLGERRYYLGTFFKVNNSYYFSLFFLYK